MFLPLPPLLGKYLKHRVFACTFDCTLHTLILVLCPALDKKLSVCGSLETIFFFYPPNANNRQIKRKIKLNWGGLAGSDSKECLAYEEKDQISFCQLCLRTTIFKSYLLPRCFVRGAVVACSLGKEEWRIITNSKVNYSLIKMDCHPSSLSPSHTPCLFFPKIEEASFHVVSGGNVEVSLSLFLSLFRAEGLTETDSSG